MTNGIGQINKLIPALQQAVESKSSSDVKATDGKFTDVFSELVNSVNSVQQESANAQEMLASGEAADLHQVMIAVEEAGISMDLFLEIRNRLLEGYQSLVKMPM
ncbi:MAG: flagellar hook-basal body complex protein FliE [candidate division Zixibacteria bacterium]|nr:flagellar hook-basal body complex protein FliE [candidate division Zixibacteria bacterium]